jgi:hypothetical protein
MRADAHWRVLSGIIAVTVASACTSATSITGITGPIPPSALTVRQTAFLDTLQRRTFNWFWERSDPNNGLTPDRWPTKSFSSVAAIGFALTAYPSGSSAVRRARGRGAADAQCCDSLQRAAGIAADERHLYHGFFYHFLDMQTGYRFEQVELSSTSLLSAEFFSHSPITLAPIPLRQQFAPTPTRFISESTGRGRCTRQRLSVWAGSPRMAGSRQTGAATTRG